MNYLFEISWEVCNRVGGIYTVLSTHARTLEDKYGDGLCFIGPDIRTVYDPDGTDTLFSEEPTPMDAWRSAAVGEGLKIRTGRWNIPGRPLAVLVDFRDLYPRLNQYYADFWNCFQVDSLHGYGDYAEACAFALSAGEVLAHLCDRLPDAQHSDVTAHFHEWTTGMGLLYCKRYLPQVSTVFTTHATSIGRSICSNGKDLYAYMEGYDGDQMAGELHMESKHSLEKTAARLADCFTTVSDITARECRQLLGKEPDVVTPNGFEDGFVLPAAEGRRRRQASRRQLLSVAEAVLGYELPADALLLATSGRYEYRNKGFDVFLDSLKALQENDRLERTVVAWLLVPGDVSAPRQEVLDNLARQKAGQALESVWHPYNTHWMNHIENDPIINGIQALGLTNRPQDKVKVISVPCYLHGDDGIFNVNYYDLLQGFDLTAFLSYYEPWGYTPLESIAFSIPTLTTSLSGFGAWVKANSNARKQGIEAGVEVLERLDGHSLELAGRAAEAYVDFSLLEPAQVTAVRRRARELSRRLLWPSLIACYEAAYRRAAFNHQPLNQIF